MRKIILINILIIVVLLGLMLAFVLRGAHDLSSGVTTQTIRAVALGMTEAQVITLLGEPLARETREDGRHTLQFSRPVTGVSWYPMLWVYFRNGQVTGIYAKRYILWLGDDNIVYLISANPRIPAYIPSEFEKTFPSSKR
jgi:hypothetical protein